MPSQSETERLWDSDRIAGKLQTNLFSKWTLWWITGTLTKGYKRPLQPHDIYEILPEYAAEGTAARVRSGGEPTEKRSGGLIAVNILQGFFWSTLQCFILLILMEVPRLSQPVFLELFLDSLNSSPTSDRHTRLYAALLVVSATCFAYLDAIGYLKSETFGVMVRSAYSNLIYKKILKLREDQHQIISSGTIINLLSTDVECVCENLSSVFESLAGAFNMAVSMTMMYLNLGWCSLVGSAIYGIFLLPSLILSGKFAQMRLTIAKSTDNRVKTMNEIITAIRVIKYYCWEKFFQERITEARGEIHFISISGVLRGAAIGISKSSEMLAVACMFIAYHMTGHEITASKVFSTMLYCHMIAKVGMCTIPRGVQKFGQAIESLERIEEFLLLKNGGDGEQRGMDSEDVSNDSASIELEGTCASWENSAKVHQLRNLTLSCKQGTFLVVAGPVGSGKSSLLMLIAKEMPRMKGRLYTCGRLSYCPQDPWIFHGTVQENILFGQKMNYQRYREVLSVCALMEDLNAMIKGDLTVIGERGLTLSGGQKARVSLARAVYREADIYLLDDPLSAVDTKVGCHIFQKCLKTFLQGKTRVLATHQVQHLPHVDKIILLEKGEASFVGTYDTMSMNTLNKLESHTQEDEAQCITLSGGVKLLAEEMDNIEAGDVQLEVYLRFVQAGGVFLFATCVLLFVILEVLLGLTGWYMMKWTEVFEKTSNTSSLGVTSGNKLMHVFTGFAVSSTVVYMIVEIPLWIFLARAGKRLHDSMFYKVIRAPTRFFDVNPVGTVLNRFSRDMGFVDLLLPNTFRDTMKGIINLSGELVLACAVFPWLFLVAAIMSAVPCVIYWFSVPGLRQLKRLEARARSPVYSHISETLRGLQSIRILDRQNDFLAEFNEFQDDHAMRWFMYLVASRWLALVLSFAFVIFFALAVILLVALKHALSPALVGLCITYLLTMLEDFEWMFRQVANLGTYFTSVERILSYNALDQETEAECDIKPPDNWLVAGKLQFHDVSLYYYEGAPAALEDINVNIYPGERIGIVGRTGSGKSSFLHSLMRLTEPIGKIYIDGVNTKSIGLWDLRENISVIPQDSVLFSGTLRSNLDPQDSYNEQTLWDVLRKVQLSEKVNNMIGGLDAELFAGGSNLSVGQRQLVCLARALLKKNRILVLDEATANIDKTTDQIIQVTLRLYFRGCTVLIIAHRLDTVMDCNKIMVLDQGKLVEFGVPYQLLQNQAGLLRKYVQQTDQETADFLYEIAEESFINRLDNTHSAGAEPDGPRT